MQTGAANYADNNIKFNTWRGFWVTTVCPWTAWPDVMSWCSSVFCLLWKVWHDFPSAVFAKVRQFRLIPHCLKWVNEMQGSLKVFHAPGWTPFEIQPRLLAPYKGETTPMVLQSLPRTRWCTYRAGGAVWRVNCRDKHKSADDDGKHMEKSCWKSQFGPKLCVIFPHNLLFRQDKTRKY